MSITAIAITAVISFVAGLYCEYRAGRADVKALEQAAEVQAKLDISKALATITTDIKAWESKATVDAKAAIAQFEARFKQIL